MYDERSGNFTATSDTRERAETHIVEPKINRIRIWKDPIKHSQTIDKADIIGDSSSDEEEKIVASKVHFEEEKKVEFKEDDSQKYHQSSSDRSSGEVTEIEDRANNMKKML